MKKNDTCVGTLFCDESGFSGNLKKSNDYENLIKQPLFITAGIFVKSIDEYNKIKTIYIDFLKRNNITDTEFKGKMFAEKNNQALIDFIDIIVNEDFWYLSVIDKKFDFFNDALYMLSGDTFDEKTYPIYEISNNNSSVLDSVIKDYFLFLNDHDFEKYYNSIIAKVNFGPFKNLISVDNLKQNFKNHLSGKKIIKHYHNDSLPYICGLLTDKVSLELLDFMSNELKIIYDKNEEFENLKADEYSLNLASIFDISFIDSETDVMIQLADNVARLFNKYFCYKIYEPVDESAEKIFKKLNFNYYGKMCFITFTEIGEKFIDSNKDFRDVIDDHNRKKKNW